jgi:chromosome segregation ATPase
MSFIKSLTLAVVLFLVTFCFVSPTKTLAQTIKPTESVPADHDQTLRQLLNEVHELRLAVQRATVNNSRFQMLVERVKVQQSHVEAIRRQLDNIRSQLADMRNAMPRIEQRISDANELAERTTDSNQRWELASQIKLMKGELERLALESERLREREAAIDTEMQTNQAKLNELNSQLDALMSELKGP